MTILNKIDTKSTLAKLLATENITVEENNVRTASFDVKNRVLTLPVFKHENKNVIDMLIAHECAHALWTGTEDWISISNESEEYRAYCNVLEDCRIDRMIQKKYPGVTKNYIDGYKELIKIDFFGVNSRDLNTLNLIDRINLYYKSSKTENIDFTVEGWVLDEIDNLKSFDDVKILAKKLLQVEESKQESNSTDSHDYDDTEESNETDSSSNNGAVDDDKDNDTIAEGQNENQDSDNDDTEESNEKSEMNDGSSQTNDNSSEGADSQNAKPMDNVPDSNLMPETLQNENNNKEKLTYNGDKLFKYFTLPDVALSNVIISNETFRKDFKETFRTSLYKIEGENYEQDQHRKYYDYLKSDFKKFKNDSAKIINYLVKEFEMKKSADAYKKSSTDKTGTLDPLKLKNYKFSDDLFKRVTITPDGKNHGFLFLLDWSGSMHDCLKETVDQLIQLVYFAKKINIPFEVYAFTDMGSNYYQSDDLPNQFKLKSGDIDIQSCKLINFASHKLKKTELDESLLYLYHCAKYYADYYRHGRYGDYTETQGWNVGMKKQYYLGSTPLNESLVILNKLIPLYKSKYAIQKMTMITLTDGHSNRSWGKVVDRPMMGALSHKTQIVPVIKDKNKKYAVSQSKKTDPYGYSKRFSSRDYTNLMVTLLKKKYDIKVVGFHIVKTPKDYSVHDYLDSSSSFEERSEITKDLRVKGFMTAQVTHGYDDIYLLNKKKLSIQQSKIDEISSDMKTSQIKRLFAGGMKNKLNSRILLNKFIEKVA